MAGPITGATNLVLAALFFSIHATIHLWTIILPFVFWQALSLSLRIVASILSQCGLSSSAFSHAKKASDWCNSGWTSRSAFRGATRVGDSSSTPPSVLDKDSTLHGGETVMMTRVPKLSGQWFGFRGSLQDDADGQPSAEAVLSSVPHFAAEKLAIPDEPSPRAATKDLIHFKKEEAETEIPSPNQETPSREVPSLSLSGIAFSPRPASSCGMSSSGMSGSCTTKRKGMMGSRVAPPERASQWTKMTVQSFQHDPNAVASLSEVDSPREPSRACAEDDDCPTPSTIAQHAPEPTPQQLTEGHSARQLLLGLADTTVLEREPWYNRHVSSIFALKRPHVPGLLLRREIIQSKRDNCDIALDWALPQDNRHLTPNFDRIEPKSMTRYVKELAHVLYNRATCATLIPPLRVDDDTFPPQEAIAGVVVVIPGLTSSSSDSYIQRFARHCLQRNFAVAVINSRGLGGHALTAPRTYCASFTCDIRTVLRHHMTPARLIRRFKFSNPSRQPMASLVGFSLGANIACNFLAEEADELTTHTCIRSAALICGPYDFPHGMNQFYANPVTNYIYQPELLSGLRGYLNSQMDVILKGLETGTMEREWIEAAQKAKSFREFDDQVVSKHHGFKGADEYYQKSQCINYIHRVRVPTICLGANDDPVVGDCLPHKTWQGLCDANPYLTYVEVPYGGHIGFLGTPQDELVTRPNLMERLVMSAMEHHHNRDSSCVEQ